MSTVIERVGIVLVKDLANQLIKDLATVLTLKNPQAADNTTASATFESNVSVDPLYATQAWRLRVESDTNEHLMVYVGTSIQLPDDGTVSLMDDGVARAGELGSHLAAGAGGDLNVYFFNRAQYQLTQKQSYPMNYRISATNRGVSLMLWETNLEEQAINYSWFALQRPTNNVTGAVLTTGKCPVFCLYAIKRLAKAHGADVADVAAAAPADIINRITVREADIIRPSLPVDADTDTDDSFRSINKFQQVSITEDGKYVLSFPNGLHTKRFAYPNYELDMVAYSSADVVSESSVATITAYGEATPRHYRAMMANSPRNTGMRIYQYSDGGESLNSVNPA
jgi:hypothetical protein